MNTIAKTSIILYSKALLACFASIISFSALAQNPSAEYLRQQEQIKKAKLMQLMDSGVYYMDLGKYEIADQKFVYVLNNIRSVPSDLTFYFGKNSFYLLKYKQTTDWLSKYIQLKGTTGQFSKEAIDLQHKAEAELLKEQVVEVKKTEEAIVSSQYEIDCGPSGIVACPVCKGAHVVKKKGPFGDEYKTCLYCNEHGTLTCEEYNKLSKGELKPRAR